MNILLIGGSGRLGGAFERQLGARHRLISPAPDAFDITDSSAAREAFKDIDPDWIVNCAAYTNVDAAEGEGAASAWRVNALAPAVMAGAASSLGIPFMQISTDYVFGRDEQASYKEDDQPAPLNVYGESKWLGELATLAAHPGACVVRTSRLYGPAAVIAGSKPSFDEIVRNLAAKAKTFPITRGEIAIPTLVDDLVLHVETHLLTNTAKAKGIFHAANGGPGCTWFEWAKAIVEELGLEAVVAPGDPKANARPAARPSNSTLVSTRLPSMRPWRDALGAYLRGLTR
jgi:dTDP-4-dehydrorhamnose reductase